MFEKIKDILGLKNIPTNKIRTNVEKIPWDHSFLLDAILWSSRSHDPQTQCGCVLAKYNTVLSTGYNGFISEIDDVALPNLRPWKYDFMVHAEHNAILNCARRGVSTSGATAYISGPPCNWCLQYLWQAGISQIVYTNFSQPKMIETNEAQRIRLALLLLMDDRMDIVFIPYEDIKKCQNLRNKNQVN